MAMNKETYSATLQAAFKEKFGAKDLDALGNPTGLKDSCDILATFIEHIQAFAQFNIIVPQTGTVVGTGGGVPGPVVGTATIISGTQPPGSNWIL